MLSHTFYKLSHHRCYIFQAFSFHSDWRNCLTNLHIDVQSPLFRHMWVHFMEYWITSTLLKCSETVELSCYFSFNHYLKQRRKISVYCFLNTVCISGLGTWISAPAQELVRVLSSGLKTLIGEKSEMFLFFFISKY